MADAVTDRLRRVSSPQNALVKDLRRALARGECTADGYCAIESVRIVEEAIRSGLKFKAIFFSAGAEERAQRLLPQIGSHVETLLLPEEVFAGAVVTESPQGVAALVKLKESSSEAMLQVANALLVVTAGIQDPGNLGTILRSAEAFGATGVLLGEGTVSRFNAKVVRASAGSLFRLHACAVTLPESIPAIRAHGLRLVATSSHKGVPLDAASLGGALALFVGNEGAGLPKELLAQMDQVVTVPHSQRVESLNASVAAGIALYEVARQRAAAAPDRI